MKSVIEASYPISFRKKEAAELGTHLKNRHSVVLIGMKRVGISNFLRFFLNHDHVVETYIKNDVSPISIQVDLNDLIERNVSAFWTLLLTRVVDTVQRSTLPESVKRQCRRSFVQSIQLKDHFFTLDSVRKSLEALDAGGYFPVLFFIRFDRMAQVVTPEFFSNLVGLRDAVKGKISYVFTSYRPLGDLAPDVFTKPLLSVFSRDMYLTPASDEAMRSILKTLEDQYHTSFDAQTRDALIQLSGGYVQYLQLAILRLRDEKMIPHKEEELKALLVADEQIVFQSEELFDSLTKKEKEILLEIKRGNAIDNLQKDEALYLWRTGMIREEKRKHVLFSPLFDDYLAKFGATPSGGQEFTKKEHLLFSFLQQREGQLCEREAIIEAVWPEHQDLGVSDWAIDRLVARLRSKLKAQDSPYSIVTVVTRGYKLLRD